MCLLLRHTLLRIYHIFDLMCGLVIRVHSTSCLQRHPTGGTLRGDLTRISSPLPATTLLRCLLQHLCFSLHHPLMHLIFDLDKGRFGMRSSPLFHVAQNLCTFLYPGVLVHRCCYFPFFLRCCYLSISCLAWISPLQKIRAHPNIACLLRLIDISAILAKYKLSDILRR